MGRRKRGRRDVDYREAGTFAIVLASEVRVDPKTGELLSIKTVIMGQNLKLPQVIAAEIVDKSNKVLESALFEPDRIEVQNDG